MKTELRRKLEKVSLYDGEGIKDEDIHELLIDSLTIKEYGHSKHRWYTTYKVIVRVCDYFFVEFASYTNSGDESAFDNSEWIKMVLESAKEVEPYERIVIDYKEKE